MCNFAELFFLLVTVPFIVTAMDPEDLEPNHALRALSITEINKILGVDGSRITDIFRIQNHRKFKRQSVSQSALNLLFQLQTLNLATPAPNVPKSVGQSCTDDTNCAGVGAICRPNAIPGQGQFVVSAACSQVTIDSTNRASKVCNCTPLTQSVTCSLSRNALICQ